MKKKIIMKLASLLMTGILAVEATCTGIGENTVYAAETDTVESESDGANNKFTGASGTGWILDADGLLTISGEPKIESSVNNISRPEWYSYREKITKVKVGAFKPKSTAAWFYECTNIKSISFADNFDTSSVTDMSYMFYECCQLTSLDVSGFDTSKVTDMGYMFGSCYALYSLDVSGFDTSKVTNMHGMFWGCISSLDVSNFDTSNVTDMGYMFYDCMYLHSLDVSGFDTSKVTDMSYMFYDCSGLTSLDVSGFDTSNVTDMRFMFYKCSSLTSLDLSDWDTSHVTDMNEMFDACSSLTSLDLSDWNTSNVTDMCYMFYKCSSLTSLDLSSWTTSNVTDMNSMFIGCSALKSLDVCRFDTSNAKGVSHMFPYNPNFERIVVGPLSHFKLPLETMYDINGKGYWKVPEGLTEPLTLYASVPTTYRIIFDANGGSGSMAPQTASFGELIVLKKNSFEKADNSFVGWNTSANGSGTSYSDLAIVKNLAPLDGSVTLYAQWEKNTPEPTEITQDTPTVTPTPTATVSDPSVSENNTKIPTVTPTPEYPEFNNGDTVSTKSILGLPNGAQTIDTRGSVNLMAVATTAHGENASVTWLAPVGHVLDSVTQEDGSLEIKAVGPGTAYVTAVSGTKTKTVKYIVKQTVKTLDASANAITLGVGEKYRLCVTPDAPTTDKFYFESSDKNICSVDQKGLIKAKKAAGSATITIYAYDNKSEKKNRPVASVAVNVESKEAPAVSVTDVSINYLGNRELYVGEMGYVSTLINNGANNGGAAVKYTMNNKGIVKIDTYGHVTAKKSGTVTITAICGGKADSITLIVRQPLKLYKVNKSYVKVAAPKAGKSPKKVIFNVKTNPTMNKFIGGGGKVSWTKTTKHTGVRLISDDGKGKAVFEVPYGVVFDTIVTATIYDPVTGKSYSIDCVIDEK
ncbi:MAG: BspA family leucine-rich repeat surface protein [Lachnospiraceae bacterium]|nr:BspA family leucine-rich repeat surface protein [Lachnospiraceae bacterium]